LTGYAPKLSAARTFPAALPMLSLDRIYLRGLRAESAEVLHGALWAKLSDHAPVIATVHLD
jgi:endonuclease/exonuclease/phosphatase family metal-dependent hydrolase